jgi:hypothetical protein
MSFCANLAMTTTASWSVSRMFRTEPPGVTAWIIIV